MKKLIASTAAFVVLFAFGMANADSSGNFTATGTSASCVATPAVFDSNTSGVLLSRGHTVAVFHDFNPNA